MPRLRSLAIIVMCLFLLIAAAAFPAMNQAFDAKRNEMAAAAFTGESTRFINEAYQRESDRCVAMFWRAAEIAALMLLVIAITHLKADPEEDHVAEGPTWAKALRMAAGVDLPENGLDLSKPPIAAPPPIEERYAEEGDAAALRTVGWRPPLPPIPAGSTAGKGAGELKAMGWTPPASFR